MAAIDAAQVISSGGVCVAAPGHAEGAGSIRGRSQEARGVSSHLGCFLNYIIIQEAFDSTDFLQKVLSLKNDAICKLTF